ncbi:MAG: DUF5615 family PIN-like protein [Bryobacteraceae bacterium]|nr:DUF5615 family PIN-like protein [Bryobacteraceae bacterium]
MARFYTNENIELQIVQALRALGHDVLTSFEAGNANRSVDDDDVLSFAVEQNRVLVSHNRLHFVRRHWHRTRPHVGIVVCSVDLDYAGQAQRIHDAVGSGIADRLVRVNRP